ncbi:hypothetical protein [Deinococcus sonorensis]|uniref:Uncharacterized protein n=1 Tax=Deinococcus sonorensis TaxID=309891 RepID=A0ABV8Y8G2_9DEIO
MNHLERQAVERILAGVSDKYPELASQAAALVVASRRFTGVAVFTDFERRASPQFTTAPHSLQLGDEVVGDVGSDELPVGFVLYADDGTVTTLECFVDDGL